MSNIIRLIVVLSYEDLDQSVCIKNQFNQLLASNNWYESFNFLDSFDDTMYICFRDTSRLFAGENKSLLRVLKESIQAFPWKDSGNIQVLIRGDQAVFAVKDTCKYCDITSQLRFPPESQPEMLEALS